MPIVGFVVGKLIISTQLLKNPESSTDMSRLAPESSDIYIRSTIKHRYRRGFCMRYSINIYEKTAIQNLQRQNGLGITEVMFRERLRWALSTSA